MVDEAAKAAGYTIKAYHGARHGGFTKFGGRHDFWYFSNSKKYANVFAGYKENGELSELLKEDTTGYYTPKVYEVYLKIQNPFITEDTEVIESALYWDRSLADLLRNKGYDALVIKDMSQMVVLYPEQIKEADPVTYDNNGNVIPLSERFNTNEPDIRYQDRFDDLFDIELSDDMDDTDLLRHHLTTHNEAIGEAMNNKPTKRGCRVTASISLYDLLLLQISLHFIRDLVGDGVGLVEILADCGDIDLDLRLGTGGADYSAVAALGGVG